MSLLSKLIIVIYFVLEEEKNNKLLEDAVFQSEDGAIFS